MCSGFIKYVADITDLWSHHYKENKAAKLPEGAVYASDDACINSLSPQFEGNNIYIWKFQWGTLLFLMWDHMFYLENKTFVKGPYLVTLNITHF